MGSNIRAGLVALTPCGHWWVYPATSATAAQLHHRASFNLGVACSFCLAAYHHAANAKACGTATRVN